MLYTVHQLTAPVYAHLDKTILSLHQSGKLSKVRVMSSRSEDVLLQASSSELQSLRRLVTCTVVLAMTLSVKGDATESHVDTPLGFNSFALKVACDLITDSPHNSLTRRNAHQPGQQPLP